MNRTLTRGWLIALVVATASFGGAALLREQREAGATFHAQRVERPRLALLTSLPLVFGEQFGLESPRRQAMVRIEREFDVVPVPLADAASLAGFSRLLMAHPRAQPAEVLVELDAWVRRGGQVVLLADPMLKWDSSRALGDRLRPPPDFADTGLLAHWGLRLGSDDAGEGRLRSTSPDCRIANRGLTAQCAVGRGTVRVTADADFMMLDDHESLSRLEMLMAQLGEHDSR